MANHGRRLGRGLGALFPTLPDNENSVVDQQPESPQAQQETTTQEHNAESSKSSVSRETQQPQLDHTTHQQEKSSGSGDDEAAGVSRETSRSHSAEKKNSRKRPTMPSLADSVHPSNMFFGNVGATDTSGSRNVQHSIDAVIAEGHVKETSDSVESTQEIEASEEQEHDVSRETQTHDTPEARTQGYAIVKEPLQDVTGGYLTELQIHDIVPNAKQPRTIFDEDDLDELSRSIAEVGILQPIVVRPRNISTSISDKDYTASEEKNAQQESAHYELIMGERRWRASQRAGLDTIPAIVRTTSDGEMLREALLENLQRVALNPLEEAAAYQQMLDEFGITQAQLSKSVSKSRPQIANTLRLLQLPASVQKRVASGVLSAGHARALLSLGNEEQMEELANRIVAEGLSVRSTEEIVSLQNTKKSSKKKRSTARNIWAGTETLQRLEDHFNTTVMIRGTKKRGKIEINFASEEDFQRILDLLNSQQSEIQEWK